MMRHTKRHVQKQRPVTLPFDNPHRFGGDQVGGVARFVEELVLPMPGAVTQLIAMRVRVDLSVQVTVGPIESILSRANLRPQPQVPFAGDRGRVSPRLERPGERDRRGRQRQLARSGDRPHDAVAARVDAGQQRRPSWRASRKDVIRLETNPGRGQAVEMRRKNFRVVISDVIPTLIVGDDEDEVGCLGRFCCKAGRREDARTYEREQCCESASNEPVGKAVHGDPFVLNVKSAARTVGASARSHHCDIPHGHKWFV